ncbi:MAG: gliding motility-associated C-terminal domain-containing protein, partial [Bacteroidetes bacterium]|nr:gliding motility-associated C-terminal domain-containing protein [Bacteroidota bacterium]
PMPGKYKVYFDVYTKQVNCKARYTIDVAVHPNPKGYTNHYGDFFCSGNNILFKDSSQIVTGHIDSVKWLFDDNTVVVSDSLRTYKRFNFDPSTGDVTRNYYQIPISDQNCTDTIYSAVNIWPAPVAGFKITSPDTIKCLPSARWTFTSTTTTYYDTFALSWDAGNGTKSTARELRNVRYTAPGIYKIKLLATETQFGCIDSSIQYVEVLKVPEAKIFIPDTIQCFSDHAFTFIDSSDGKYLKALWTIDNTVTDTNHVVNDYRFNKTGKIDISLTVDNGYAGCTDTKFKRVYILENPKASFTINNDTQCLNGNAFTFINTSQFFQPYRNSQWTLVAPTVVAADTNFSLFNFNAADTGNYVVSLIISDQESCLDTATGFVCFSSHTKSPLTINDDIQCLDSNRFVFKTIIGPNEIRDWKIDQKLEASGSSDNLVRFVQTPGWHVVTVVGKNSYGCNDSSSANFRVLESPVSDFSVNNDTQCLNAQSFSLNDQSSSIADVINQWQFIVDDTLNRFTQNINQLRFSKSGRFKARLLITTNEGCHDTSEQYLTVTTPPLYSIVGDTVCLGELAFISSKTTGNTVINSYRWLLGDGDSALSANVQHEYFNSGNYNLRLAITDQYGCKDTQSAINSVIIRPLPDATFNTDVEDFGINQVKLKFIPSILGYAQYVWIFPDGNTSTKDTPSLIVRDLFKGQTQLIVVNQFGCRDSSEKYQYVYPNNFNVYIPNAISINRDLLNDEFKPIGIGATKSYRMSIFNRWGEEIFSTSDPEQGWDGTYQNSVVMQDTYTYFIEFTFIDGKTYQFKGTLTVLR